MGSKIWIYLSIAAIFIFMIFGSFMFLLDIVTAMTLGNRVEDKMIASGWAGFSEMDLKKMSQRKNISNKENRESYLDKSDSKNVVIHYLKKNLKLNDDFTAREESFITVKNKPILIDEITIYNPDDLPTASSEGEPLKYTTIHMILEIPVKTNVAGIQYARKSVYVDEDSFLTNNQK